MITRLCTPWSIGVSSKPVICAVIRLDDGWGRGETQVKSYPHWSQDFTPWHWQRFYFILSVSKPQVSSMNWFNWLRFFLRGEAHFLLLALKQQPDSQLVYSSMEGNGLTLFCTSRWSGLTPFSYIQWESESLDKCWLSVRLPKKLLFVCVSNELTPGISIFFLSATGIYMFATLEHGMLNLD